MKDISKKIVEKIKEDRIVPESKFKLEWKNYFFWFLMFILAVLGALFVSLVIFNFSGIDKEFFRYLKLRRLFHLLIFTAPFLWIILSLSALVLGVLAFRKTARGYRHSILFVSVLMLLVVSILAVLVHFSRMNDRFERGVLPKGPKKEKLFPSRESRWMRPEDGVVAGKIKNIEDGIFWLEGFYQEEWSICYDEKTKKSASVEMKKGERVGVIGEKNEKDCIQAFFIKKIPPDWDDRFPKRKPNGD